MSKQAHPNINAVGLVVSVMNAIHSNLRGRAKANDVIEKLDGKNPGAAVIRLLNKDITDFALLVSTKLDERFGR